MANIKYSPWKMWYIASMVRGLSVDEAVRQLGFVLKKGAVPVRDTILQAQQMAIQQHNVEFKSNLWVGKFHIHFALNIIRCRNFIGYILVYSGILCD